MKVSTFTINGTKENEIELPLVFSTSFRKDLISNAFTNLTSHKFQPQGRHPTAGMDVVARSNDPPTGWMLLQDRMTHRLAKEYQELLRCVVVEVDVRVKQVE